MATTEAKRAGILELCDRLDRSINWAGATSARVELADLRRLIDTARPAPALAEALRAALECIRTGDHHGDANRVTEAGLSALAAAGID